MCPVCMTTAALMAGGATSVTGALALVARKVQALSQSSRARTEAPQRRSQESRS